MRMGHCELHHWIIINIKTKIILEFSKSIKCIYPGELELKLGNSGTHATVSDLDIT